MLAGVVPYTLETRPVRVVRRAIAILQTASLQMVVTEPFSLELTPTVLSLIDIRAALSITALQSVRREL